MIKVAIKDMLNAIEGFNTIASQEIKGSLAFRVARLRREMNKELEIFDEQRAALIKKYCLKDEEGNPLLGESPNSIKLNPDTINDFDAEYSAIIEEEVEINAEKLKAEDAESFNITPQQMELLLPFFD